MCRGRIEQIGTPDEVRNNPASAFVFHFTSDVNHLPSTCAVRAHPCCCSKLRQTAWTMWRNTVSSSRESRGGLVPPLYMRPAEQAWDHNITTLTLWHEA